jgi:tetratricopeptide (TPR) repeat protein
MQRCPVCDQQMPDRAAFCMYCGAPLSSPAKLSPGLPQTFPGGRESRDLSGVPHTASAGSRESRLISVKQPIYKFPSLPAAPRVIAPGGLPRAAAFVGRRAMLIDLMAKLRMGENVGIFALAGMGGIGKTALAAEAAARLANDDQMFPGGAAWIACDGLTGEAGLAELWNRVARALGMDQVATLTDQMARRAALTNALSRRERLLLALDNLEPTLDAETALSALAVPGATVLLVTGREKIEPPQLTEIIELPPLEVPDACALFVQRLHQTDQGRPTPADELDVPRLLALMGGLPLVIELTAAYAGVMGFSLEAVRQEIEHDGLFQSPQADRYEGPIPVLQPWGWYQKTPQRSIDFAPGVAAFQDSMSQVAQRVLRLCCARTWQKLTPRQQRLFASLALLAGSSFPRRAVLALAQATPEEGDPLAGQAGPAKELAVLIAYALVEPLPGERLRLHPLLRAYAAERLARMPGAQQERLGKVMLTYWSAFAEAHPGDEGIDALEAEAEGLLGALAWAHDHARHRDLLALADAIGTAWDARARREEELRIYTWAVQAAQALKKPIWQRWAAHQLATTQRELGQLAEAYAGYEQALTLAKQLGDLAAERVETHALAALYRQAGRRAESRAGYERALALARQLGDLAAEREEVHGLAVLDMQIGRRVEARRAYERALSLAKQLDNPAAERVEVHELAVLDWQTGQLAEARAGYERALILAKQLGDLAAEREEVHGLAVLDWQTGQLAEARARYERALDLAKQLGDLVAEREEVHGLAVLDAQEGRSLEARAGYEQALTLAKQLGDLAAERLETHALAILDAEAGRLAAARTGLERALALAQQLGDQAAEASELRSLGSLIGQRGEIEQGRELIEKSLAICELLGDIHGMGDCHQFLAWLARDQGNNAQAVAHYREALRCYEKVQSPSAEGVRTALQRSEVRMFPIYKIRAGGKNAS